MFNFKAHGIGSPPNGKPFILSPVTGEPVSW
jgi:hypothetical protein